jgi:predicted RND superfamily exporter protein/lauroyl/myristoyl acyltransferase
LRFDVEIFDLLPNDLPAVQGLRIYQEHFSNARELLITIRANDGAKAESAARAIAEKLRTATDLVSSVTWQPPWQEHPDQMAELIAYLWFNQPPTNFAELANRLATDKLPKILATTREELTTSFSPDQIARLSYDPFGLTRLPESVAGSAPSFQEGQSTFASTDGKFRIIFVQARQDLRTYRDCNAWLKQIHSNVNSTVAESPSQSVSIGYTGRPAFVSEIAMGMEHDVTLSVGGTACIIAVLFYLAHRRLKPMLWLLTLLALTLASTLGLGGLVFSTLNVVSLGFAAILLGLAVDYAVVHYQEALAHPNLSIPEVRHAIAPSIFWAAVTTISAFLVLNFGGLPGLAQLGTLVGLGVALAAFIMIFEFLPPLFPDRNMGNPLPESNAAGAAAPKPESVIGHWLEPIRTRPVLAITFLLIFAVFGILVLGLPKIDPTANALRPRNSPAYLALAQIQSNLTKSSEPIWVLVGGQSEADVGRRLREVKPSLEHASSNRLIAEFNLPTALWPEPEFQAENRATAIQLISQRARLHHAAETNGFAPSSLALMDAMLNTWQAAAYSTGVFWPTNPVSRWLFEKFTARTPTNFFALGLVTPTTNQPAGSLVSTVRELQLSLPRDSVWLSDWALLGDSIFSRVRANLWKLVVPMVSLVLLSLVLAFRRFTEPLLSISVLMLSVLCLLAIMRVAHWSWNLLNLMAIPLVLGTGVDYSIFIQLALRRHHGNNRLVQSSVGRALLLCGGTAVAGFGSLGLSSNIGMASFGQVCAVGVGCNMLIAIFLLPTWWGAVESSKFKVQSSKFESHSSPSSLYRPFLWRIGLFVVRFVPSPLCGSAAKIVADLYRLLAPSRTEIVRQNLAPALGNNANGTATLTKQLFRQFAVKVTDLWRFEAGLPLDHLFSPYGGWEQFAQAQAQGHGVLLLTPHLGNWEFGGPVLAEHGVRLLVVTQPEPGTGFTQLRQASRARWNIDTLVIGDDPFAFMEIIRRLQAGAVIALLVDRPPPATAVNVELFGRPFPASIAAAELARASGCVLLPVYIPRTEKGYTPTILPPINYDRAALRDLHARHQLTQQIIRAFEPIIRQHLDQWYHFVPVWQKPGNE